MEEYDTKINKELNLGDMGTDETGLNVPMSHENQISQRRQLVIDIKAWGGNATTSGFLLGTYIYFVSFSISCEILYISLNNALRFSAEFMLSFITSMLFSEEAATSSLIAERFDILLLI